MGMEDFLGEDEEIPFRHVNLSCCFNIKMKMSSGQLCESRVHKRGLVGT